MTNVVSLKSLIYKEVIMFADYGRQMPQEFNNKERCLQWLRDKQYRLPHSLKLLAKEKDRLVIRTPITNEYIEIYGTAEEINYVHLELVKSNSYTYN